MIRQRSPDQRLHQLAYRLQQPLLVSVFFCWAGELINGERLLLNYYWTRRATWLPLQSWKRSNAEGQTLSISIRWPIWMALADPFLFLNSNLFTCPVTGLCAVENPKNWQRHDCRWPLIGQKNANLFLWSMFEWSGPPSLRLLSYLLKWIFYFKKIFNNQNLSSPLISLAARRIVNSARVRTLAFNFECERFVCKTPDDIEFV